MIRHHHLLRYLAARNPHRYVRMGTSSLMKRSWLKTRPNELDGRRSWPSLKKHLITHTPVSPDCEGCLAKTRAKPHFRKAFKKDGPKYTTTVTMDQVTVRDEFGTGVSAYRYGIVLLRIGKQYWSFVPLRTLVARGAELEFREICLTVGTDYACTLVYCDCHASLVKVCSDVGVRVRHPPPARPQANAVIERLVGLSLQGIRAYLTTAGMPNCFWPLQDVVFASTTIARSVRVR